MVGSRVSDRVGVARNCLDTALGKVVGVESAGAYPYALSDISIGIEGCSALLLASTGRSLPIAVQTADSGAISSCFIGEIPNCAALHAVPRHRRAVIARRTVNNASSRGTIREIVR